MATGPSSVSRAVCKTAGVTLLGGHPAGDAPHEKAALADQLRADHGEPIAARAAPPVYSSSGWPIGRRQPAKPADAQFDRLVLAPLKAGDRRELADLLGIEPAQVFQPKPSAAPAVDPNRSLADQTASQVAQALAGQGGNPRPDGLKPLAKGAEPNPVLALTMLPVRPSRGSAEIKRFLEGRKPARPGTVQVMLVLRSVGT